MKLLIVDDEAPARAKLRRLLGEEPDVSWLGEAADADEALQALQDQPGIDALILDIQMPGQTGLDLAMQLLQERPELACLFCTAYDEHALQAFDLHAVDYLLKPYTPERLATALQRLRGRLQQRAATAPATARGGLVSALQQLQPAAGHWLVEKRGALRKLALAEIEWVATADNYIELHAPPETYLERRTLADFLAHPATAGLFIRVHRGHAVNASHVKQIASQPHGEALLTLTSGQLLRVSRSYRDQLRG
ncbi:response regulator [Pelomonas sp. V22]|uniref:LytR/AlgR family response regulator transcription factor n=1 Tax=Pelomonas sp. V22 TaxID=2822139 RepID=UPI0024A82FDA|nr:response regulator [Pelomonas sp. V22]MDI4634300.1 response regulator [Pelomonas sp. V22]